MILAFYRIAAFIGEPVIRLWLSRRRQRGKEDSLRINERFGVPSEARPSGTLTWIHAASVGEALSVLCLIERLHRDWPELCLLITTGTVTSAAIMKQRLPLGVIHQYAPVDHPRWIGRFLDYWRPELILWVESEFWPNMLGELASRKCPAVLINARISQSSFSGWSKFPATIKTLLSTFTLCLAQSDTDSGRLVKLGASNVSVSGNLKFAANPLPAAEIDAAEFIGRIGNRAVWAAISTHEGEETVIAETDSALRLKFANLLTFVAPRHPVRGAEVTELLRKNGSLVAQRSNNEPVLDDTQFYVFDTVGELGLVYRLAKVAFIGGSLIPHGGQNLLEAAKLNCAILHGPYMTNFLDIVEEMREAEAVEEITNSEELAKAVARLLKEDVLHSLRVSTAAEIAASKYCVLESVIEELTPFLKQLSRRPNVAEPPTRCHAGT